MWKKASYLYYSLLCLAFLINLSCSSDIEISNNLENVDVNSDPLVVYIVDENYSLSKGNSIQLKKVFNYTKIPFSTIPIQKFIEDPYFSARVRVVFINDTRLLTEASKEVLLKFVALGGTLIFPTLNEDQDFGYLTGVRNDVVIEFDTTSLGMTFKQNMLPGIEGLTIHSSKINYCYAKENFRDDISVIATSASDPELPTIIEFPVGKGNVIHFNTNIIFERQDRGLLFSAALKGLEGVPYPIVNVSTIMIDDFPAPLYDIKMEPISTEFDITQAEYVTKVWWPDMLRLSEKFNIEYSAYPSFNYNLIKEPPFSFSDWDRHTTQDDSKIVKSSDLLTQQVLQNGFELGIHGYNHESLLDSVWENKEYLEGALKAIKKKWVINGFGNLPKTYVPPSNEIDSIGLFHLANAMPEIEFMASTYDGLVEEGGGREYDIDPFEPRLFDFPRITSGYIFNDIKRYNQESLYLFTGIWSHFIHPDDIFQIPVATNNSVGNFGYRNPESLGWYNSTENRKGMLEIWTDYLEEVVSLHPSTRFKNVYDGASSTRNWRESEYLFSINGDGYNVIKSSVNEWNDEAYFWNVFIGAENEARFREELEKTGYDFVNTPKFGGSLYTVETPEPIFTFEPNVEFFKKDTIPLFELYSMVYSGYEAYNLVRDNLYNSFDETEEFYVEEELVIEDSVQWFVQNEELSMATDLLLRRLNEKDEFDSTSFSQYALYLAYQDRPNEVWTYLEQLFQKGNSNLAFRYIDLYLADEYYPSIELNELWLRRMITQEPGNIELVKEYLDYFYSQEYQLQISTMLENLLAVNDSSEAYQLYLRYLIDLDPETLVKELEGKDPSKLKELHPFATRFAYTFANQGDFESALLWSEYSDEISITSKLQWWLNLEAYNQMESVFLAYIQENPDDFEVMSFASNALYDIGKYEKGALISSKIPINDSLKTNFMNRLNGDVRYFETDIKKYLISNTSTLFFDDTLQLIRDQLRFSENNFIEYNSDYEVDNFQQSVWNNLITFNYNSKSNFRHLFSATYSDVSDLNINGFDANNVPHTLYGLRYRIETKNNFDKPNYYALAGLEQDDVSNNFLTLGTGVSFSTQKSFQSLSYTYSPIKTGPAISRQLYFGEVVGYFETGYLKKWQLSLSPNFIHYSTGVNQLDFTGRLFYNIKPSNKSRFSPYAEAFLSTSNSIQTDGNPFWVIDQRVYGGGGLAWTLGQSQSNALYMRVDAGMFYDSYTGDFLRVTGEFSFPVKKFTHITGRFGYFNQDLYYSNSFQLGIKYFMNRKKEYSYKPRDYDQWYR